MAAVLGPHVPRHPTSYRPPKPSSSTAYKPPPPHHISSHPNTSSSSGSSQQHSHHHADSFYGHEEVSKICARFVSHTFNCPEMLPPTTSSSSGSPAVPPTLAHFVAYALHRTRLHPSVTFTALALLCRLKTRFPAARGSSGHRLFLSAFMIASKVVCDDTYSNKSWAVVGQGMFALREINQMEREMCAYLEWHLNVPEEDLKAFEKEVRKVYSYPPPYAPGTAVALGSSSSATVSSSGTSAPAPAAQLTVAEPSKDVSDRSMLANQQLPTPTDGPTLMPFSQAQTSTSNSTSKPILAPINTTFGSGRHASHSVAPASKPHGMPTPPASPPPASASSQSTTGATLGYLDLSASGPGSSTSPLTDSPSPSSSEDSLPTPPNAQWSQHPQAYAHPQLAKSMSLPIHQQNVAVSVAVARPTHGGRNSIDGLDVSADSMDDEKKGVAYYAAYPPASAGGPHMALKQQTQLRGTTTRSQSLPGPNTTSGANQQQTQAQSKQQRGSGRTFTVPCAW